jgi:hypothetical protein
VHRGVALRAASAGDGAALPPPVVTASGRFAFRRLPPGEALVLEVTPHGVPFFPARLELPPAAEETRHVRVALAPRRGYPFAPGDLVIHRCLHGPEGPIAGAEVAPEPTSGFLAAPSRTDADGEFVLYLRPGPSGDSTRVAAPPRRVGLVFALGAERRLLPEDAGPALPDRGRTVPPEPEDAIRWDLLTPLRADDGPGARSAQPSGPPPRPRRGQRS